MIIDCFYALSIIVFLKVSQIHARLTRSTENNSLHLPRYRSNRSLRSIKYRGNKVWSEIPSNFKYFSSYSNFVKHCKKHLIDST